MQTETLKNELLSLRKGTLDISGPLSFEHISGISLIDELKVDYPHVFQCRDQGKKREIGMARKVAYELTFQKPSKSIFYHALAIPILSRCFLISTYDDQISEVTWSNKILILPVSGNKGEIALRFGSGFKLDRTPDGWTLNRLQRRKVVLSEAFLKQRGWQFDAIPQFNDSKP